MCLCLPLYISFLLFELTQECGRKKKEKEKSKCPNNKKEIYNDKYKQTRDRLFDLKFLVHRDKYSL